jgi:hypothetical protein
LLGLYSHAPGFVDHSSPADSWSLPHPSSDPLQHKTQLLLAYCFPTATSFQPGSGEASAYNTLKGILAGDNVKAFLHEYRHYHSHWPLIHAPTFDPVSANLGLVLTMCCIGAVYSDRLGAKDVRWFMEIVRGAVLRSSSIYRVFRHPQQEDEFAQVVNTHVEELQALVFLHSLFVWHGSQSQRQQSRDEFGALANIARRAGLLQALSRGNPRSSALHTPGPITGEEVDTWSWSSWIENEKRTRLMAYIFLIDASSTIFFNTRPQFDVSEITVPLPADDAAWEARTAEDCASALGLRGQAAQIKNVSGSRRAKQLGMAEALQVLYGAGHGRFPERATNVFGKFSTYHVLLRRRLSANLCSTHPCDPRSNLQYPGTAPPRLCERHKYAT